MYHLADLFLVPTAFEREKKGTESGLQRKFLAKRYLQVRMLFVIVVTIPNFSRKLLLDAVCPHCSTYLDPFGLLLFLSELVPFHCCFFFPFSPSLVHPSCGILQELTVVSQSVMHF